MKNFLLLTTLALFLAGCAQASGAVKEEIPEIQAASEILEAINPGQASQTLAGNILKEDADIEDSSDESADSEDESSNSFAEVLIPPTSTPVLDEQKTLVAAPLQQSNCYYGCSETLFDVADTLFADSVYFPIGVDSVGQWLNILGPESGQSCWLPNSAVALQYGSESVQPGDLGAGTLISVSCPANPTPIPGETANNDSPPTEEGPPPASTTEGAEQPESSPGRYARLMHDPQWMEWPSRIADPDWPRGFYYDWYPETVPLWLAPKGGDGRIIYSVQWLEYLRTIQLNDEAAVWIARVAAGLFNKGNEFIPILTLDQLEELPTAEGISSGGNVVRVLETKSGSVRIEMLFNQYSPPDPDLINYFSTPWLVTKFTAVSVDGELGNPGGIDVYFPNLARQSEGYWVDKNRVELFPQLPYHATVRQTLSVRQAPSISATSSGQISPSELIIIKEYLPQASNVWGRINGGWVLLEYQNSKGVPIYTTSWSMGTRPPILFP